MSSVKQRLSLRISSFTAFLRSEVGLVRGQEPQEGDPESERKLREWLSELQTALSDSQAALSDSQVALSDSKKRLDLEAARIGTAFVWKTGTGCSIIREVL